ncbi:histidine phosphotransferase [Aureimonas flava]|uniref:Histidine phosphotransferase n=1 Tax=Aureimonas flava TaxID=2320271 RepID=A0A3A1WIS3_9HYPH|nr:histidine phosphotransferase family protein [Aureimonas flava]RIX98723.1 histidine phosphotransferase [Aureimonas flava]
MTNLPALSAPDLAALLASRLCHDIISPVGAIQSGLELLDDMPDDPESMALVRSSTKSAVAKLQFARIAYGASGSSTAQIDMGDARTVAEGWMAFEKANLQWSGERAYVPKNIAKLVLNLLVVANASVPRGREVEVSIERLEPTARFTLRARGKPLRVPAKFRELLAGETTPESIDAHGIQPYYALLLAREAGLSVRLEQGEEEVVFHVVPADESEEALRSVEIEAPR